MRSAARRCRSARGWRDGWSLVVRRNPSWLGVRIATWRYEVGDSRFHRSNHPSGFGFCPKVKRGEILFAGCLSIADKQNVRRGIAVLEAALSDKTWGRYGKVPGPPFVNHGPIHPQKPMAIGCADNARNKCKPPFVLVGELPWITYHDRYESLLHKLTESLGKERSRFTLPCG